MATISFLAGENFTIADLSGSGLGFYGSDGFGASVAVSEFQGRTFITNSAGTSQGPEVDTIKFLNSQSGIVGQAGTGIHINYIPNYQATLNIRFTHSTAVQTQNIEVRAYDRVSINNNPSGVTFYVFEAAHPNNSQASAGSGDTLWTQIYGSGSTLTLNNSPGISGLYNNGAGGWSDVQHDWYLGASASPDSIGSKLFALYVSLEYL